ncbi:MAG: DNA-binding response regulator [Gammaproteobacteria bacterium]|nr:MAG: DNA-binding response regulator [Gammaproteobacteria bacterium]
MKILLIEDDQPLAAFIIKALTQEGFLVEAARDGTTGLRLALEMEVDLVIVDIMLPIMDGFTVIARLREKRPSLPILVLSAKRSVEDKVTGLELGSDDYLTKPFSLAELLARIRALLRRRGERREEVVLRAGDLAIDLLARKVTREGEVIELLPKEFALLEYQKKKKNRVLTRMQILDRVWGYQFDPESNVVDVHICRLRDKLGIPGKGGLIRTIRGAGYMMVDDA